MPASKLQDHYVDVRETARVAAGIHEVCCGEEAPVIIAALIAELVTQLVGPMTWQVDAFTKLISEVAQCVQTLVWTTGQRHN